MLITAKPRNLETFLFFYVFNLLYDFNFDSFWIECHSDQKKYPSHKVPLKKMVLDEHTNLRPWSFVSRLKQDNVFGWT